MKDRTPRYPGRVVLTPVAGEKNTYDMVRADSPVEPGTPINKALFDYVIAATGTTGGTATAFTLAGDGGFELIDGATILFKLHCNSGATPTINVNGKGAKKLMKDRYSPMPFTFGGTWLSAVYCADFDFFILRGSTGKTNGKAGQRYKAISSYMWVYGAVWQKPTDLTIAPYFL